ncbi:iron chelate uptake ABC transporter family permease subunit [Sanguibacter suaedae]|nr:iron chelate uptake ABC transporter family permease subunit [Sanguibacter suaedae]
MAERAGAGLAPAAVKAAPATAGVRTGWRPSRTTVGWVAGGVLVIALVLATVLYDNRLPVGSAGFRTIVTMRLESVATIVVVAFCHGVGTVIFHTATGNRILTPSILGFDALYRLMQTSLVFVLGGTAVAATGGLGAVAVQTVLMVGFATLLYGWLFSGRRADLHVLLLVGVVLGMGFASVSTFMQRMLTPSEFDVLSARLFGNISGSDASYLPWAAAVCVAVGAVLWRRRHVLDVVALGRDVSTNLGLNHRREVLLLLVLVALLVSVSTTMVGPMTFFGFVVATLTYQVAGAATHARLLPLAALVGTCALLGAYFVLRHVFYAAGLVTVIIELVGGLIFLVHLLRKGLR